MQRPSCPAPPLHPDSPPNLRPQFPFVFVRSGPVPGRYWELTFSSIIYEEGGACIIFTSVFMFMLIINIHTNTFMHCHGGRRATFKWFLCLRTKVCYAFLLSLPANAGAQKYATLSCSRSPMRHSSLMCCAKELCIKTKHNTRRYTHTYTWYPSSVCECVCVIKVHFVAVHAANAQQHNSMWSLRFLCASTGCSLPQGTLSLFI